MQEKKSVFEGEEGGQITNETNEKMLNMKVYFKYGSMFKEQYEGQFKANRDILWRLIHGLHNNTVMQVLLFLTN